MYSSKGIPWRMVWLKLTDHLVHLFLIDIFGTASHASDSLGTKVGNLY
ncbi:hypothetical protein [Parabacteroides sp.]